MPRCVASADFAWVFLTARSEDPYTEGHVWIVTMVKVKYGMMDTYLNDVMPLRKKIEGIKMMQELLPK